MKYVKFELEDIEEFLDMLKSNECYYLIESNKYEKGSMKRNYFLGMMRAYHSVKSVFPSYIIEEEQPTNDT